MFENILGQQKVKKILLNQIKSGRLAHAYIFAGQEGVGKRLLAIELAKILNCAANDSYGIYINACGKCFSCEKIAKNLHPDLHFIDFAKQAMLEEDDLGKQKVLKIETIRYMQKEIATKIYEGRWKIFILEPAEKMSIVAANSLLKIIEEPHENTMIVLIAQHTDTVLRTIVSRSQTLFFQPLKHNEISTWLMLNHSLDATKAHEIAGLSDGSFSIAKKFVDEKVRDNTSFWYEFKNKDFWISDILEFSKNVAKDGSLKSIDRMIAEAKEDFRRTPEIIAPMLDLLNDARALLLQNISPQTVLDNLFFDLLDLKKAFAIL
ncbi:MAG: hypothetical protein LBS47_01145 [Endomicrobium sp.]|jgi:DNA polymerase-3 subunit delta'|nr:hypothetical protein [Endomicrobium sp.]